MASKAISEAYWRKFQDTSGYAGPSVKYYYNPRYVTNPSSPGPEVAFLQYSGPAGLLLGTHGCSGGGGPVYKQSFGAYEPVAYYSSPATFCLLTYSNSGSGDFSGNLSWD